MMVMFFNLLNVAFILMLVVVLYLLVQKSRENEIEHKAMQRALRVEINLLSHYKKQIQHSMNGLNEKKFDYDLELAKWQDQRKLFEKVTKEKIKKKKIRRKKRQSKR